MSPTEARMLRALQRADEKTRETANAWMSPTEVLMRRALQRADALAAGAAEDRRGDR